MSSTKPIAPVRRRSPRHRDKKSAETDITERDHEKSTERVSWTLVERRLHGVRFAADELRDAPDLASRAHPAPSGAGPRSGVRAASWGSPQHAEGDIVDDRFVLERLAARGGMANIWQATDAHRGAAVALKLHARRHADAPRLEHEAAALRALHHPALVEYVAHGDPPGSPYLAMEWLDGEDLAARLTRGPLAVDEARALGQRIAAALGVVHGAGLVHCDLKPGNVFLCDGRIDRAKLVDFGVSRAMGAAAGDQAWATGTMVGTPGYMAPEQFTAEHEVDARADLFALGALVFECLTGSAPFAGKHPMDTLRRTMQEPAPRLASLRSDVPAAMTDLVAALLQRNPADRPSTAAAVAARLA